MGALTFLLFILILFFLKLIWACRLCVIYMREDTDSECIGYDYTAFMDYMDLVVPRKAVKSNHSLTRELIISTSTFSDHAQKLPPQINLCGVNNTSSSGGREWNMETHIWPPGLKLTKRKGKKLQKSKMLTRTRVIRYIYSIRYIRLLSHVIRTTGLPFSWTAS